MAQDTCREETGRQFMGEVPYMNPATGVTEYLASIVQFASSVNL
jgi:hypothetical protein